MNSDAFKLRLKEVIGDGSIRAFADRCDVSEGTLRRYLQGGSFPPLDTLEKIAQAAKVDLGWLAAGHQQIANGNGIVQGQHIDAEEIHIDIHPAGSHVAEKHEGFALDPLEERFLNDWRGVSDIGKMRVWTFLKEEIQKEKERG